MNGGRELVVEAAAAAASKKAQRIVILDVSKLLVITDHFLICSGTTERQVRTIADEIERRLLEASHLKPYRREGERDGRWVLLDYVDFVVHVFREEEREYFDLERLWADAPRAEYDETWEGSELTAAEGG